MNRQMLIFFSILALLDSFATNAQLTSERLGFAKGDKVLIIHADDIGMSHTVNRASFDAFKKGMVKSGSIMLPCPWVNEVRQEVQAHASMDLGVHAVLTSEWKNYKWPPLSLAPTLRQSDGYFWPSLNDAVGHGSTSEVLGEIEAQIKRAISIGIQPTHIDSHMGVYFAKPDYLQGVVDLAQKYQITPMLVRWTPEFEAEVKKYKLDPEPIKRITQKAEQDGIVLLDYLVTGVKGNSIKDRHKSYDKLLRSLKPGVTQIITHLGYHDDEMKGIMIGAPEGELRRYSDFLYFTSPRTKALLRDLGIHLIGWKEMNHLSGRK